MMSITVMMNMIIDTIVSVNDNADHDDDGDDSDDDEDGGGDSGIGVIMTTITMMLMMLRARMKTLMDCTELVSASIGICEMASSPFQLHQLILIIILRQMYIIDDK